jgi:hypothetical protein
MINGWQKISSAQSRDEDKITITKSLGIGFTNTMYNSNNVRVYKYVRIYYNQEQNSVGINFTNEAATNDTFKIIHRPNKKGASVKARNLFKQQKIDVNLYQGHYEYERKIVAGIGILYVIKLKEREKKAM